MLGGARIARSMGLREWITQEAVGYSDRLHESLPCIHLLREVDVVYNFGNGIFARLMRVRRSGTPPRALVLVDEGMVMPSQVSELKRCCRGRRGAHTKNWGAAVAARQQEKGG